MSPAQHPKPVQRAHEGDVVVNWRVVGIAGLMVGGCLIALASMPYWLRPQTQGDAQVAAAHSLNTKSKRFADMPPEPARPAPSEPAAVSVPPVPDTITRIIWRPKAATPPDRHAPAIQEDKGTIVQAAKAESLQPSRGPIGQSLRGLYEWELLELLDRDVVDVDLDTVPNSVKAILDKHVEIHGAGTADTRAVRKGVKDDIKHTVAIAPVVSTVGERPDLKGLPMLLGSDCKASDEASARLAYYAGALRELTGAAARSQSRGAFQDVDSLERRRGATDETRAAWKKPDAVPALVQVLQAEDVQFRLFLVRLLSKIEGPKASVALAQRALFDFAPEVREAALQALKARPATEYRPALLKGFRYPWPPIADHAASALVLLRDREAAADLVDLLDLPDPKAPFQNDKKQWVAPELVRINHLRNCVLCHAPSVSSRDPVRGLIPIPGVPIRQEYYQSTRGSFVRADITYLRQDFSLKQPVSQPDKWPLMQRFDYLVRLHTLTDEEVSFVKNLQQRDHKRSDYPQRRAVLAALRGLTGENLADETSVWQRLVEEEP